jgi:hypothetical protein
VGDFNGDGFADLAVTNLASNSVSILLGNGNGTFTSGSPITVGNHPLTVAVGDFNGDGFADLAVPNDGDNNVSILLNHMTQTATAVLTGVIIPGSGPRDVKATYPGDANFVESASGTTTLQASLVPTTTALELSTAATITFGTPVTLTAIVTPHTVGNVVITGTVNFYDGTTLLGNATVNSSGEATLLVNGSPIPNFSVGTHALMANYQGDTNFNSSPSSIVNLTVSAAQVTVSLVSSSNPSSYGQAVTFTATVPSGATGTIQFENNGIALGTVTISGTTAAYTASALTAGTHPITAAYSGDTSHSPATSGALSQLVTPAVLTVTATNATRVFRQPNPTLTATIAGFVNGDTSSVVTGSPSLSTTATIASPVGSYPIIATQGTLVAANYIFTFVNGTLTVTKVPSSVGLSVPTTPSVGGSSVSLTATVPPGATGTVTFYEGTTVLGTATISGTTATLVISTLAPGSHTITAVYNGDANFAPSTSAPAILVITAAPDFAVSNSTPPQLIPPGASASYNIAITSVNAPFTNVVTLTATNLPPGATYTPTRPQR